MIVIENEAFWKFATVNPGTTLLIFLVLAYAATRPFKYAMLAYNRRLRAKNIAAHGWPTPPMDADGDIVYPDQEAE